MRMNRLLVVFVALLGALSLGSGCPVIPEIEERVVELAVGGSTVAEFTAAGELNTHDDVVTVDAATELDLGTILDDAGIDVSDVKDAKISGVSYRVTQPEAGRSIVDGNVTVQRAGGAVTTLISDFDVDVSQATGWTTATLNPAAVAILNDVMGDLLDEVKGGPAAANTVLTFSVSGNSVPADVATNFKYEIKLDISVLGTVTLDVVN